MQRNECAQSLRLGLAMIENQIINKAIDFIFSHIDEQLSVDSIAGFCGYSKFYLSRLFKAETGESIYGFIKRTKIEQSAWRLKVEQGRSITEISGEYGYSASNYATLFRDYFEKTGYSDYIHYSTCGGYYDCEKLNNIYGRCRTSNEINFSQLGSPILEILPNRCPPAEISIIRTNMKLYNFVKQSEEQSSELNEETFNLTKFNVKLTKAMLVLAAINAIGIIVQIWLQIFS